MAQVVEVNVVMVEWQQQAERRPKRRRRTVVCMVGLHSVVVMVVEEDMAVREMEADPVVEGATQATKMVAVGDGNNDSGARTMVVIVA